VEEVAEWCDSFRFVLIVVDFMIERVQQEREARARLKREKEEVCDVDPHWL